MQRAPRRVALEALQVERLGDDSLACEGRVAVDEDGQRDRWVVQRAAAGAIRLLGPSPALDDRGDCLEVAGVRRDGDLDLSRGRPPRAGCRQVVLDVAASSLRVDDERVIGALALELAQHRLVRATDGVDERVEASTMRHADHDLVGPAFGGEPDRLVEHRDEDVDPLERELLLAEERAPEVLLEAFDLCEAAQKSETLLRLELHPEAARLDRLPQPDPLRMVRDVLDLVRARARVDLAEARQCVEEGLAGHGEPQQAGRDPALQLGRERRHEPRLVECRVTGRLGAERIEPRREVPMRAVRLDERHRRRDRSRQARVLRGRRGSRRETRVLRRRSRCQRHLGRRGRLRGGRGRGRRRLGRLRGLGCGWADRGSVRVRRRLGLAVSSCLEDLPPLVRDTRGTLREVLEELGDVGGVRPGDVVCGHPSVL